MKMVKVDFVLLYHFIVKMTKLMNNNKKIRFEIRTPDVSIKVAPDRTDLIETRVIGGVKYIMICAEENVEVNGVSIHIADGEPSVV